MAIKENIRAILECIFACERICKLEQQPCEMTTEEYRQRMIQTFHNADTDELIAVCVLPTEKEFEHLEWLLKNHYKKAPCVDAISRQAVLDCFTATKLKKFDFILYAREEIKKLPPVTPQKYGHWIWNFDKGYCKCSECGIGMGHKEFDYCPNCGAKMQESEAEKKNDSRSRLCKMSTGS